MRKIVLAVLLGAAVVGTSLFPPLGDVSSALANKPLFVCTDGFGTYNFASAKDARAFERQNAATGMECSPVHNH